MAKFFGSYLERKPVDRTVLRWLTQLPDDFYVFVELQGGDFQVDFLVLKPTGIFNIEAKNWQVRRAHLDLESRIPHEATSRQKLGVGRIALCAYLSSRSTASRGFETRRRAAKAGKRARRASNICQAASR